MLPCSPNLSAKREILDFHSASAADWLHAQSERGHAVNGFASVTFIEPHRESSHGGRALLARGNKVTLKESECILKAVALKPSIRRIASVKRTHKGPLRDILAKNMRRIRAARGLSQEALAHECGINRTYLSAVERAERNVSVDNIARIATGLQVEPWTLLKED